MDEGDTLPPHLDEWFSDIWRSWRETILAAGLPLVGLADDDRVVEASMKAGADVLDRRLVAKLLGGDALDYHKRSGEARTAEEALRALTPLFTKAGIDELKGADSTICLDPADRWDCLIASSNECLRAARSNVPPVESDPAGIISGARGAALESRLALTVNFFRFFVNYLQRCSLYRQKRKRGASELREAEQRAKCGDTKVALDLLEFDPGYLVAPWMIDILRADRDATVMRGEGKGIRPAIARAIQRKGRRQDKRESTSYPFPRECANLAVRLWGPRPKILRELADDLRLAYPMEFGQGVESWGDCRRKFVSRFLEDCGIRLVESE